MVDRDHFEQRDERRDEQRLKRPIRLQPKAPRMAEAAPAVAAAPPVAARAKREAFVPEMPLHLTSDAPVQRVFGSGAQADGRIPLLELGWDRLVESKVRLARDREVLPELEEPPPPKPLRRQPAFIVSMAVAGVTLVGVGAMFVLGNIFREPDRVSDLVIQDGGDNYVIEWSGPDVPYSVVMTDEALDAPADLSAMLKGREVWVPKRGLGVTSDSCFTVRSAEVAASEGFSDDPVVIDDQGGARVCVLDAVAR